MSKENQVIRSNYQSSSVAVSAAKSAPEMADEVAMGALLRCWLRETSLNELGAPRHNLELRLPRLGLTILAEVVYWSNVGWHRFGSVTLNEQKIDAASLSALLALERRATDTSIGPAEIATFVRCVSESTIHVGRFITTARAESSATVPESFLDGEQSLVTGHPFHPAPKSREGITEREAAEYSPEMRGKMKLHWFAADSGIVESDSDLDEAPEKILMGLCGSGHPTSRIPIPTHPWQAQELLRRPEIKNLIDSGELVYLGPSGREWHPTSSLRTVYRDDSPIMLKLTLGMRVTNSRRENRRVELERGIQVHRLLSAGLQEAINQRYPNFKIIRDPAWVSVKVPGYADASGLDVILRENPFRKTDRVLCVAGLLSERPGLRDGNSILKDIIMRISQTTGRSHRQVGEEWFERYFTSLISPLLWIHSRYGLGLEAHQQNSLIYLDEEGWPVGGGYRDNQGYYFSESRSDRLYNWIPGVGRDLGSFCEDSLIDERLSYYVGVNNLLGLVGAMGSQGIADEVRLVGIIRRSLLLERSKIGSDLGIVDHLLGNEKLRCKANLLTHLSGYDELVAPLEHQSVYVEIDNPIFGLR